MSRLRRVRFVIKCACCDDLHVASDNCPKLPSDVSEDVVVQAAAGEREARCRGGGAAEGSAPEGARKEVRNKRATVHPREAHEWAARDRADPDQA
ncbi:MAG: hypothetical protein [CRESS virus sp. ct4af14]|nr:MAG: hypothetical protein [CRESS virus sp. ct4af14]